jgi:hypothetical protein
LETALFAVAGVVTLVTHGLGRRSPRWRVTRAAVGANLVLCSAVGCCPASLVLGRAGLRPAAGLAVSS